MRAKNISGTTPGGKRVKLSDVVPLDTPFLLYVFPIYQCNFKCQYCIFSVPMAKRGFISDKPSLSLSLFKQCIDDATKFPQKIKVIRFVGMGEPLLHKDISEMVSYASSKNVANIIEIITNGSLLTPELTDSLISSGLNRLIISLQGTSADKYKEICGTTINFDVLVKNIEYFYNNKKDAHLYIKIVDTALTDDADKQKFYSIFGNICDDLAVEHTVPIYPGVDYKKVLGNKKLDVTQFGIPVTDITICPQPFFVMQINPDGKIVPCFSLSYPEIIADCNNESINEIWTSNNFNNFRLRMLNGTKNVCGICGDCNIIKYRFSPEDDLLCDKERIRKRIMA